jgi:hypothetical protein
MEKDSQPALVLIGGFLGAGKTTLMLRAAHLLGNRGTRVAVITNDQAGGLVDTHLAVSSGLRAEEVTGGCFCCRFSDLLRAAGRLAEFRPQVIFAEPVGSCVDLSATILQPIKSLYGGRFRLAPHTVLVDPERAAEVHRGTADPQVAWLFRNQLREADIVCFSKADLFSEYPALDAVVDFHLSARTGAGLAEWLREVLAGTRVSGARLLDIDYQTYAEAEAALGWLNWDATVDLRKALSPPQLAGPLLEQLDHALTAAGARVAHLKIFDRARTGYLKASVCRNGEPPSTDGDLTAPPARHHEITLNLRASAAPESLRRIVEQAAATLPGRLSVTRLEAFRPAPPRPEHRFTQVAPRP